MHNIARLFAFFIALVRRDAAPTLAQAAEGPRPALHTDDAGDTLVTSVGGRALTVAAVSTDTARVGINGGTTAVSVVALADGANADLAVQAKGTGDAIVRPGLLGGSSILADSTNNPLVEASSTGLGFYGHTPAARPAHIANSTDADAQIGVKINAILAALRSNGLIASS